LLVLSSVAASAQTVSELGRSLDPLFQRVLSSPQDLDSTLAYAAGIARTADIESAISTYEQLLFYNPTLSRTRFELGLLYYRLGSYDMARGYFRSALEMQDITPDLRQRAEQFLTDIDKRLRPDQFSGFASTGLRYQTNASGGVGPQAALASGKIFDSRFFAHSDWNWFGAFTLNYSHDFETQRGDTFEASLVGYDAQQFALHQFDVGLLELRAGPRFGIPSDVASGLSFKPYVIATGALLADAPFYGGLGGGVTAHVNAGSVALDPYVEVVQQSFLSTALYPLAGGMSGTLATYGLQAAGPLYAGLGWQSRVSYAHAQDVFDPDSYDRFAADIWLPWKFAIAPNGPLWTVTPTAGITYWSYAAPDPNIDPLTTQRTLEWRVGLGLDVPIWEKLALGVLVEYRADLSNVAVFSMRDLSVTVGPTIKF